MFRTFSVMFLDNCGQIPHMWQALLLKSYRYAMCKRMTFLNKNHIFCSFSVLFDAKILLDFFFLERAPVGALRVLTPSREIFRAPGAPEYNFTVNKYMGPQVEARDLEIVFSYILQFVIDKKVLALQIGHA